MPSHPDRVRTAPLPEGYQFGDARQPRVVFHPGAFEFKVRLAFVDDRNPLPPWRAPHLNTAAQLQRRAGWNVIEGEDH